jgi:hypothetical protein
MARFVVLQTVLSDAQIRELNGPNGGWNAKPEFSAYAAMTFGGHEDLVDGMVLTASNLKMIQHVATIDATTLREVFDIGNIGPEEAITRLAPMRSISVGDLVYDIAEGKMWFCNRRGWTQVGEGVVRKVTEGIAAHKAA